MNWIVENGAVIAWLISLALLCYREMQFAQCRKTLMATELYADSLEANLQSRRQAVTQIRRNRDVLVSENQRLKDENDTLKSQVFFSERFRREDSHDAEQLLIQLREENKQLKQERDWFKNGLVVPEHWPTPDDLQQ